MFELHAVQAAFGDCLLIKFGSPASPRFILIDGGPPDTYKFHLKPLLKQIRSSNAPLDLVVLSHVDNDHTIGLLEYFAELRTPGHSLPTPGALWHNSFTATIDPNGVIAPRLTALISPARASVMAESGLAVNGIGEGSSLRVQALALGMPMNQGFGGGLVTVDNAPAVLNFANLKVTVVGPTQANLDALEQKWIDWLDTHEPAVASGDPFVMANSDQSVPNLSSIMLLAEGDGRRMLLTGDGRSDHLLDGLAQASLLDTAGKMHVDVLKMPHHGSNRNITRKFLTKVTADVYVASANGKDDNPDLATLIWIAETAKAQGRQVQIVVTNQTPSTEKLLEEYPPTDFTYSLRVMPAGAHHIVI